MIPRTTRTGHRQTIAPGAVEAPEEAPAPITARSDFEPEEWASRLAACN